jgi:carboxypeptidase C (cathepsin A)
MKIGSIFFLLLFYVVSVLASPDRVVSLPGFGRVKDLEFAGYLPLSSSGNLFYWFVESRTHARETPTVLWLNGGPGAASLYGFFMENGPFMVNKEGVLSERQYAWTTHANYWVIDQPAGVGLSYGKKGIYTHESEAMDQLYHAIQLFFWRHPELATRPLYLAGESYAGKYLPQLAMRILSDNSANHKILLKGLLIGDGWVNPRLQQSANVNYAYSHGLIDQKARKTVLKLYQACIKEIDQATPSTRRANQVCEKMQDFIKKASGGLVLANIYTGTEPDDADMVHYLNKPEVRKALHVDPRVGAFNTSGKEAAHVLEIGEQDSVAELYPALLAQGVRVLIYNGLEDAKDSNFMSTDLWLSALNWPGKKEFSDAPTCVWRVGDKVAGYAKTASGLTQVKIRNAGHLAPIDQPEWLLDLFNHFISNQPVC